VSRGLGKLQREIIETLDDAKLYFADPANGVEKSFLGHTFTSLPSYKGGSPFYRDGDPRLEEPGWVTHGRSFRVSDNVYDLRASAKYIAKRRGLDPYRDHGVVVFEASFSRAVRTLLQRGLLHHLKHIVPIAAVGDYWPAHVERLADGDYVNVSPRQVRFVTREPI
jgi:hypothetical protein